MGRIAKVLAFLRVKRSDAHVTDITIETGGGVTNAAQHFGPLGDDSPPLPTDYAYVPDSIKNATRAALGYLDPLNEGEAAAGEKRIYARDSGGAVVIEVWLKGDGSVTVNNSEGQFELGADGVFTVNGVTIDSDGTLTTPAAVVTPSAMVNGKELADHTHNSGTPVTGPNN